MEALEAFKLQLVYKFILQTNTTEIVNYSENK